MADKQFSAFLLFSLVAFALYLNNVPSSVGGRSKLSDILGVITGQGGESAAPFDTSGVRQKNTIAPGGVGPVLLSPRIATPPTFGNPGGSWSSVSPGFFSDLFSTGAF